MKTIRIISQAFAVLSAVALQCCVSSCDKNAHSGENGIYLYPQFVNPDHVTELKGIKVWVFDSEGEKVDELDFDTSGDMVATSLKLASGSYSFVALANLRDDFEVTTPDNMPEPMSLDMPSAVDVKAHWIEDEESGTEQNPSYAEQIYVTFNREKAYSSDAFCPEGRSFYAVRDYRVSGDGIEIISLPMKSFLSEVELSVPDVSTSKYYVLRSYTSSMGFYPARKAADGSYGVPAEVPNGADLGIARVLSPSAPSAVFYLFPDVPESYFEYGKHSEFRFDSAPVNKEEAVYGCDYVMAHDRIMYAGHRYQLNLVDAGNGDWSNNVEEAVKVNDWTELWKTNRSEPPQ